MHVSDASCWPFYSTSCELLVLFTSRAGIKERQVALTRCQFFNCLTHPFSLQGALCLVPVAMLSAPSQHIQVVYINDRLLFLLPSIGGYKAFNMLMFSATSRWDKTNVCINWSIHIATKPKKGKQQYNTIQTYSSRNKTVQVQ